MKSERISCLNNLTRRSFHKAAAVAALVGALRGVQGFGQQPKVPDGRYVDVHTHLGQTWNSTEPLSAEPRRGAALGRSRATWSSAASSSIAAPTA
jgi:hypothetical protein